jgi:peptidoglycan/LPS O-acetylase OafA/YrhL
MPRVPELDALRGIAAIAIVLFHLRFTRTYPALGTSIDLFFVLSGYLITTILLNGDLTSASLRTFYLRRAFRIWPIYYLTLVVFLVVNALLPEPSPTAAWPYFFTYTQFLPNAWHGASPPFSRYFDHTWTLAIEEQFYLVWPLLICLAGRKSVIRLAMALIVTALILRTAGVPRNLALARVDGLALGGLLAALVHDRQRLERHRGRFQLAFAAVGCLAVTAPVWTSRLFGDVSLFARVQSVWPGLAWADTYVSLRVFKVALVYFSLVGFVVCSAGHPLLAPLRNRGIGYVGQISYGLYLYHPFVLILTLNLRTHVGFRGSAWYDAFRVACCLGVAALSWRFLERPLLGVRDRLTARSDSAGKRSDADAPEAFPAPRRPTVPTWARASRPASP